MRQRNLFPDRAKAFEHFQCGQHAVADRCIHAFADVFLRHCDPQAGDITCEGTEIIRNIHFC
ncbi:hypothetical protein D3C72_2336330 [compost metagenome]